MDERPHEGIRPPLEASLSHLKPSIASSAPGSRRSPGVGRASAWFVAGVALVSLGACGSGEESAATRPEVLIDAVTGETVEVPDDFTLDFDPPSPAADDTDGDEPATTAPEADDGDAGEPEPAEPEPAAEPEPGTEPEPVDDPAGEGDAIVHPLESVVIDTVVVDPEAEPVLDEAAALACANTEFAMDALIEAAPDRSERFDAAAEWAAQSAYEPVRAFAERLAADPTDAEANELVVAVLETCAAAGYEL